MANNSGKKKTPSSTKKKSTNTKAKKQSAYDAKKESELYHEIGLIAFFAVMAILFLCNFGFIGAVGNAISNVLFGLFGMLAYVTPILAFVAVTFWYANAGNRNAVRKLAAGISLFVTLGVFFELVWGMAPSLTKYDFVKIYTENSTLRCGGGVIAGSITYLLYHYLDVVGTILVIILVSSISFILLTERLLLSSMREGSTKVIERTKEETERRREYASLRRMEREKSRETLRERLEEERIERENEKILRMDKKVTGVMSDITLSGKSKDAPASEAARSDEMREITSPDEMMEAVPSHNPSSFDFDKIRVRSAHQVQIHDVLPEVDAVGEEEEFFDEPMSKQEAMAQSQETDLSSIAVHKAGSEDAARHVSGERVRPVAVLTDDVRDNVNPNQREVNRAAREAEKKIPKKYMFPPLSRLSKGTAVKGDSTQELKETAMRLQQTLHTFGVNVTITDISQGPSVTRYELQPEQGVKVSKIVGLADDIKLNLAATDIRIEAPIPGKAAVGIEVPNKENAAVALRDLLESKEFRDHPSKIAFAVGKDIAGQTVVADIAKMPHMLIAGSTGSGKSVCINTLIMSILYKAHPEDVKLILVDPKVVELSVYNGIPHLLIPVVTDPKKASAALNWAVAEMTERYKRFADYNVRDLKGYNQKVESLKEAGEEAPSKMPQIVFIVDELADLMMVAGNEVEEAICRLAQLARAAGIHLIIATQRPSVDVITGLIKANMPSRLAFAVSSGVDSRTILDMNGAEKLLGKGDMLFYPQGYTKPARMQGAFVSDREVADVVDFLKNQAIGNTYAEDIEEKMKSFVSGGGQGGSGGEKDELFEQAGRFIIDKDKASIGMLQRAFKIGFNRAARIMDQLCECGVVGEEEGTKPRKVLMDLDQFDNLLEEIL